MTSEEKLANAIILQAANDYRKALRGRETNQSNRFELETFFKSQWFEELTSCDGEYLMRLLREDEKKKAKTKKKDKASSYITLQYEAKLQKEA